MCGIVSEVSEVSQNDFRMAETHPSQALMTYAGGYVIWIQLNHDIQRAAKADTRDYSCTRLPRRLNMNTVLLESTPSCVL